MLFFSLLQLKRFQMMLKSSAKVANWQMAKLEFCMFVCKGHYRNQHSNCGVEFWTTSIEVISSDSYYELDNTSLHILSF